MDITFNCTNCGQHIVFDEAGAGQLFHCPKCGVSLIVPKQSIPPPRLAPQPPPVLLPVKKSKNKRALVLLVIGIGVIVGGVILQLSSPKDNDTLNLFCMTAILSGSTLVIIVVGSVCRGANPKPKWICAHCGTLVTYPGGQRNCFACGMAGLVPLERPRGKELLATYHSSVSAEERVETAHELTKRLVEKLESAVPPASIGSELEKMAKLVQSGALSTEEWGRAKTLLLGKPKDMRGDALDRIGRLYTAYQSGALSQSEFNMTKWDILSRVSG